MTLLAFALFAAVVLSFVLSAAGTRMMVSIAPKIGFVDKPGGRKIHAAPKPLGGGVGIVVGVVVPLLGAVAYAWFAQAGVTDAPAIGADASLHRALVGGARLQTPAALAFVGCILALHLLGLIDDRRALGPYLKLVVQLLVAGVLVIGFDVRAVTFLDPHVGGPWLSWMLSILWITAVTNAFNFLDNMDGLTAGVASICSAACLITACLVGQWFVAAALACLLGALLGFLVFNFPPARIFMGDCGSLVVGFVLGVLTIRTTFLSPGADFSHSWFVIFAPLLVLALPLYDLLTVSMIRISKGKSPFQGDKNHFSHRLVNRGMSRRTAVLCLYLVTAATSIAAIILPTVRSGLGAFLLVAQAFLVLGVVALLEQHPLPDAESEKL